MGIKQSTIVLAINQLTSWQDILGHKESKQGKEHSNPLKAQRKKDSERERVLVNQSS